jgi:type IV secretion system protein TrbF
MFTASRPSRFSRTTEPDTPYRQARELWDRRMGSAHQHARTWRTAAFASLALSGLLAAATIALALRPAAVPFVIEANESGEARFIGPATRAYEPGDAQIAWHLARFVELVRALPSDPVVVRQNWLDAYDLATQAGAQALNAMAEASDPFAQVGKTTIAVDVLSVVRASPNSFQLRWRESTYSSGRLTGVERFTGVATIVIDPPSTPERLQKNPLGLYVHALTSSRDLQQ